MISGAPTTPPEAEAALVDGIRLFRFGDMAGAHSAFEKAHRRANKDPRAMSWYGMTLGLVEKNWSLAILYCDRALFLAGPEPNLFLNQARVHLALAQRERAIRALQRGLEAFPDHAGLRTAQETMGMRRRPLLPFLSRNNPLNVWLGKLRHRLSKRGGRGTKLSPSTLGLAPEELPRS